MFSARGRLKQRRLTDRNLRNTHLGARFTHQAEQPIALMGQQNAGERSCNSYSA